MTQEILWDRRAEVTFGAAGQEGKTWRDLRITFDIKSTVKQKKKTKPNQCKIEIYNLSRTSRAEVEDNLNKIVILNVGYGKIEQRLWKGNVLRTSSVKRGTDWVTTIESGDGQRDLMETRFGRTYKGGTPVTQIINDIAGNFVDTAKGVIKDISAEVEKNGITLEGISSVLLKKVLPPNAEFSIQNAELNVNSVDNVSDEEAVLLSPETGLISSPVKTDKGMKLKALIQPRIKPGNLISLQSELINGFYKITRVDASGDTHSNNWYFDIDCKFFDVNLLNILLNQENIAEGLA